MVVVIDARAEAGEFFDRREQAAFELVIVVAVEQVVLAVVLVLDHRFDRTQPFLEEAAFGMALRVGAVGITAPDQIGFGKIGTVLPALFVDQRLQPGAIGSRLGAEDTVAGTPRGRPLIEAAGDEARCFLPHAPGDGIVRGILIQPADGPDRLVEQGDLLGKGIAEKA